jgi:hypothetical protein
MEHTATKKTPPPWTKKNPKSEPKKTPWEKKGMTREQYIERDGWAL